MKTMPMPDIGSWCVSAIALLIGAGALSSCTAQSQSEPPMEVKLYQQWELQPGGVVAGYSVTGGLGDISIVLNGQSVYAPFDGKTRRDKRGCLYFDTPNVPAYLFRLCGLQTSTVGKVQEKQAIGKGDTLQIAALRQQPNNTWAIVEPDKTLVERTLKP